MDIGIGHFARGGEFLLLVDGVCWARSKSVTSVRRLMSALVMKFPKALCSGAVRHVDEAVDYEDGIAYWPNITEEEVRSEYDGMPLYRKVLLKTRVGGVPIEASVCWDALRCPPEEIEIRKRSAIDRIDRHARDLWEKQR